MFVKLHTSSESFDFLDKVFQLCFRGIKTILASSSSFFFFWDTIFILHCTEVSFVDEVGDGTLEV